MIDLNNIPPLPLTFGHEKEAMSAPGIWAIIDHFAGLGPHYLEIGMWCGATLKAAAQGNKDTQCMGVDNFSFAHERMNDKQKEARRKWQHERLQANIGDLPNVKMWYTHYKDALSRLSEKGHTVQTYFYDGPHTAADQYDGLEMALPLLDENAVIIVDDWNWDAVEVPTMLFCDLYGWEIIFEKKTGRRDDRTWWNGVAVLKRKA